MAVELDFLAVAPQCIASGGVESSGLGVVRRRVGGVGAQGSVISGEAWRGSLGPGRDVCQQRSVGECRSGRWGYYSLAEGGGWALAPRQHM